VKKLFAVLAVVLVAAAAAVLLQPPYFEPDGSAWDALLRRYVDGAGNVDYAAWKTQGAAELDRYLADVARATPDRFPVREARLAFWINVYNACVIKRVLEIHPVPRVDHVPDFFKRKGLAVAGRDMCLDDIEHGVIRKVFADARVHAALVCAGRSCPRLATQAYPAAGLDDFLDARMREFVADPTRNQLDEKTGAAHISQIFKWYADDFRADSVTVPGFIRRFAPDAKKALLDRPDLKLDYLPYDFALNQK
jgi:hypothetical protein